jgi:hypothetical protein
MLHSASKIKELRRLEKAEEKEPRHATKKLPEQQFN